MKKSSILVTFLLLIPLALAQPENYNDRTGLTISYESNGEILLVGRSGFGTLTTTLYLAPEESSRQTPETISTIPNSFDNGENLIFEWDSFQDPFTYQLTSIIKTKNNIYPVSHAQFPIQNLDQNYEKYLEAGEIIDITPEIITKASEIVEGETELYTAVYKLADWVNKNVKYNLTTLTAEAALKSSWVLDSKTGVCDEITSLFISLSRSVGIPARFISGAAYSNLNYTFENHGWAEVYFPGQGWVPYDITFGQFGWIDPSHIELDKSIDAGEPSVRYSWKSVNTNLESSSFSDTKTITQEGSKIQPPFEFTIEPLFDAVGPGSYVPIKVTVMNPFDKYISNTITITKGPSILGNNREQIMLKPSQEKSTYWIAQIPNDINSNFIYTAELEAKDLFETRETSQIEFGNSYEVITKEEAEELVQSLEEKEDKKYSEELSLFCNSGKEYYYDFEEVNVICNVRNLGNTLLTNTEICLEQECINKDLRIGINEEIIFNNITKQDLLTATAKVNNIDLLNEINIKIFTEPDVKILGLQYPKQIEYDKEFNVSFTITSLAKVDQIEIKLNGQEPLILTKNAQSEFIVIKLNSKDFITGKLSIELNYKDEHDRDFSQKRNSEIEIIGMPWYAQIISFFSNLL
jgi:transglutaminase-like putative cysteine protease